MVNGTEQYYVYIVTLVDEIVYIGKGQGSRVNHVLSGKSHNKFINEAYYRSTLLGEPMMEVEISQWFSKEKAALSYENRLIKENKPKFNVAGNILHKDSQLYLKDFVNIPNSYEDFKVYIQTCYSEYLLMSEAENPHPLKWYVYGKLISDSWLEYYDMLKDYFNELTVVYEDKRKTNKGRPTKSFPSMFGMNTCERKAFYNMQTRSGVKYCLSSQEDIDEVESWLYRRRV